MKSPDLIFVQKAFFGGLIFGGAYFQRGLLFWRVFCVSKWGELDYLKKKNKTKKTHSLKHYDNSLKQLTQTVNGIISGRACYRNYTYVGRACTLIERLNGVNRFTNNSAYEIKQ